MIGIVPAIVGAWFLKYITIVEIALVLPAVILLIAIIYYQKGTDYWITSLCIDSIENRINRISGFNLLSYKSKFKEIQFRTDKAFTSTPTIVLQIIKDVIIAMPLIYLFNKIYNTNKTIFIVYLVLYILTILYFAHNRHIVIKESKRISTRLLKELENYLSEKE